MGSLNFPNIDTAIATAEGYGHPNAIPTLANNPGDLALGNLGNGTLGHGITIFPSPQAGIAALDNQVGRIANGSSANYSPGESIASIGQTYAGKGQQGTNWSSIVAKILGQTVTSALFPTMGAVGNTSNLAGAINPNTNIVGGTSTIASPFNLGRVAAGIIGLICIAGGIFMLKSSQTIIQTTGKVAKKAVELSA